MAKVVASKERVKYTFPTFVHITNMYYFCLNSYKKEEKNRSSRPDSFQDFQDKTDDAWDDNDDELMLDMSNIKMSLHDVRKTAEEVISNHSRQSGAKNSNLNYEYSGKNYYEYYSTIK